MRAPVERRIDLEFDPAEVLGEALDAFQRMATAFVVYSGGPLRGSDEVRAEFCAAAALGHATIKLAIDIIEHDATAKKAVAS